MGAPAPPGARIRSHRPSKDFVLSAYGSSSALEEVPIAGPVKKVRAVRDLKKGAGAWAQVSRSQKQSGVELERLLVHSISNDSALKSYLPAVRAFLKFAQEFAPQCRDCEELDYVLTAYLTTRCYADDAHPIQGSFTLNGINYLMPEVGRALPRAWRALKAWQELTVRREGTPLAEEALLCMEEWLRKRGKPQDVEAADMMAMAHDGYLREQDLLGLRKSDVLQDHRSGAVVLQLGLSSRGEKSKTGWDQGITLDYPWTAERALARASACRSPDSKLFSLSSACYRSLWGKAATAILGHGHGTYPHQARHTGASRDLAEQYRDFSQVQRRGRWKTPTSVQRYAKTHIWRSLAATLPRDVQKRGEEIREKRRKRPSKARE